MHTETLMQTRKASRSNMRPRFNTKAPLADLLIEIATYSVLNKKSMSIILVDLYNSGDLPDDAVAMLIRDGAGVVDRRMRNNDRVMAQVRMKDKNYDKKIEAEMRKWHAEEAKRPLTAKQKARKEESDRIIKAGREALSELSAAMNFYNSFKLSDGTLLKNANKEKLVMEAEKEKKSADKHMESFDFYSNLAKRIPHGKTVGEALRPDEVARVRAETIG